jgi:hypothetical protein
MSDRNFRSMFRHRLSCRASGSKSATATPIRSWSRRPSFQGRDSSRQDVIILEESLAPEGIGYVDLPAGPGYESASILMR